MAVHKVSVNASTVSLAAWKGQHWVLKETDGEDSNIPWVLAFMNLWKIMLHKLLETAA